MPRHFKGKRTAFQVDEPAFCRISVRLWCKFHTSVGPTLLIFYQINGNSCMINTTNDLTTCPFIINIINHFHHLPINNQ